MINRILKTSTLSVVYEYVSESGKNLSKRQSLKCMAEDAADEDKYAVASAVGKILISTPKSIQDTLVYELEEV